MRPLDSPKKSPSDVEKKFHVIIYLLRHRFRLRIHQIYNTILNDIPVPSHIQCNNQIYCKIETDLFVPSQIICIHSSNLSQNLTDSQ